MSSYPLQEELQGILRLGRSTSTIQDRVAAFFEETREDVYRYSLTLGLHPAQAQEATQEVFLRLYVTLKKGEEIQNWRAWVFRVAHNHGLRLRQRESHQADFDPGLETRLRDPNADHERSMIERERMIRLNRAIENLSQQQRRCLFLRMEGLRYPEIGEALGISASSVGEFLRRAIARLRKARSEGE
jgi:RNA polymerase sigma-70 factor (ECF subfamily)